MNIASLVDVGFVLFVMFAASYALLGRGNTPEAKSSNWKRELLELEAALRELVKEAAVASGSLDRSLARRKVELERLLAQITEQTETIDRQFGSGRSATPTEDSSLPNESWEEPQRPKKRATNPAALRSYAHSKLKEAQSRLQADDQLSAVAEDRADRAELSNAKASAKRRAPATKRPKKAEAPLRAKSPLEQKIEVLREHNEDGEEIQSPGILDPISYKIARRLLKQGKEIHVVARKLDLTLGDVRLLDKLIRREEQEATDQEQVADEAFYDEPFNEEVQAQAKNQSSTNEKKMTVERFDIDSNALDEEEESAEIEREQMLL